MGLHELLQAPGRKILPAARDLDVGPPKFSPHLQDGILRRRDERVEVGYCFVEPNQPLKIKWDYKSRILRSNEIVDSFVMAEEWVKPVGTPPGQSTVMPRPAILRPDLHKRTYTIKVHGRQALNNLLFAVY